MSRRPASRPLRVALLGLLCLLPAGAGATSVYLNGVKIDGVTNQQFDKAQVRIDAQGNVHIEAPGYAVRAVTGSPSPAAPVSRAAPADAGTPGPTAGLARRYWLVTEQSAPGLAEYDVDLFVNARWVRRLRSADPQVIEELTARLRPGTNTVLLSAHKTAGATRKSLSPAHAFRVIIGEGSEQGSQVTLDTPLVRFQRTAAETQDVSEEFSFTAR